MFTFIFKYKSCIFEQINGSRCNTISYEKENKYFTAKN